MPDETKIAADWLIAEVGTDAAQKYLLGLTDSRANTIRGRDFWNAVAHWVDSAEARPNPRAEAIRNRSLARVPPTPPHP